MLAKRLDAHFVACAAAAGAGVVGIAQTADAGIVYSGVVNIPIPDNIDGIYMNMVTGVSNPSAASVPGWDITPYTAAAGQFNLWSADASTWLSTGGVVGGPYKLADGAPIGPAGSFFRPGGGTNVGLEMTLNSNQNLLGFKFVNEANAGATHYGWLRLQFGANAGTRAIVEYAYENVANTAIPAGAVPAPGSLALLALGAAGVAGRRRR